MYLAVLHGDQGNGFSTVWGVPDQPACLALLDGSSKGLEYGFGTRKSVKNEGGTDNCVPMLDSGLGRCPQGKVEWVEGFGKSPTGVEFCSAVPGGEELEYGSGFFAWFIRTFVVELSKSSACVWGFSP